MHGPSSRKCSKYLRSPQMFVALQLAAFYYLEQLHQLANEDQSDAYKTNFKNLTLERLAFFEIKKVGDRGAIGILLSRNYFHICSM